MASPRLALLTLLSACSGTTPSHSPEPEPEPEPAPVVASGPSLILVTMDTTRVDRIGAYGYSLAVTPAIDAVAAEGARFEQAYAVVPLTTPSHASMLSGLYPTRHGIHTNGDATLPEDALTLAEQLQEKGYHTAASVSAFVTTRIWNLDQGFDTYFDYVESAADSRDKRWSRERRAGAVVDDLEGWLKDKPAGEPFFAWAHFYDPHHPYAPPEPYDVSHKERPYDGEIAYMDEQIGRLISLAEAAAGEEGVAIILVADHGESFGSHDERTHGMFVFDPTMRIPFIVRPPAPLAGGKVITDTVSNVDVTPTALGLLGLDVPEGLDGRDLTGFVTGAGIEQPRGPVYMESETPYSRFGFHPEWAAAEDGWKLFATPSPRLYNIAVDRAEADDRIADPDHAERVSTLDAFVDAIQAARTDLDNFNASPEVIDQLAALGYVATEDAGPMDLSGALDAKDQADLIARIDRIQQLTRDPSKASEAETELRAVLKELPSLGEARMSLARLLAAQSKLKEAEVILGEGVELQPQSTLLRASLAENLAQQNRLQEAYDMARLVYDQVPGDDLSRLAMVRYLREMDREPEALSMARQWLLVEPNNKALQAIVGEMETLIGDRPRGEQLLLSSLEDNVPRRDVHRTLAMLQFSRGDVEGAAEHMEMEVLWFPQIPSLRLELGNTYMKLERWDDAAAEYIFLARMRPMRPEPYRLYVQALFNSGDYENAEKLLAPVLMQFPDDPDILLLQANILEALGKSEEGARVFAEAKAMLEVKRQALEAEMGLPVLEEINIQVLPGLDR